MARRPRKDDSDETLRLELERAARLTEGWFEEISAEELAETLDAAHKLYTGAKNGTRSGIRKALNGAIRFLSSELPSLPGEIDRQLLPLIRLERALEDLEDGIVHECLKCSAKKVGANRLTKDQAEFRLMCCVVVQFKCTQGKDDDKVRRTIASKLTEAGFFQQRRTRSGEATKIEAGTLKNWERDISDLLDVIVPAQRMSFKTYMLRNCLFPYGNGIDLRDYGTPSAFGDYLLEKVIPAVFGHLRVSEK